MLFGIFHHLKGLNLTESYIILSISKWPLIKNMYVSLPRLSARPLYQVMKSFTSNAVRIKGRLFFYLLYDDPCSCV